MLSVAIARHHARSLLGTFIALALGVTLLSTTMIIFASATAQPPLRYAAAPILVSSEPPDSTAEHPQQFRPWTIERAEALVDGFAGIPGVREAAADLSFHAQLTVDGRLVTATEGRSRDGHNWSSIALGHQRLAEGRAPQAADEIVVGQETGLPLGSTAHLLLATESRDVRVTGVVDGTGIFLDDQDARRAAAGPKAIGVTLDETADLAVVERQIADLVGDDGKVFTGLDRATMESEADASDRNVGVQFLIMIGTITAFVSIFVVATTFAFVVTQRRRELGLLRMVGATPGQVARMLMAEAVVVGLPASVLGGLLGVVLAPRLSEWMITQEMQSPSWEPRAVLLPTVAAVLIGVLVALAGVWSASRRAGRINAIEALRVASVERRPMTAVRWVLGVLFLLIAGALTILTRGLEFGNVGAATTGAAASAMLGATLLAPAYLPWIVRLVCAPFRREHGATLQLVREGSLTGVRRVASTMAPVLITMGFVVFITGMTATMNDAFDRSSTRQIQTEQVIAPVPGSPGLTDSAVEAITRSRPDFQMSLLTSSSVLDGSWLRASGLDPQLAAEMQGAIVDGDLTRFGRPGTVAISQQASSEHGWRVGDDLSHVWADGTEETVEVIAVLQGDQAGTLFSRDQVRAHDHAALTPVLYANGVSEAALQETLAPLAAEVQTATEYREAGLESEEQLFRLFMIIVLILAIGYTGLAIANTMMMATADRARDFTGLRLTGALPGQILRVVAIEAFIVAGAGALLGVLTAIPAVYGIGTWLADDLDVAPRVLFDWPAVAVATGACLAITLAASLIPTQTLVRRKIAIYR